MITLSKFQSKLLMSLAIALALCIVLVLLIDFYRYPPSKRISQDESSLLSESVATSVEQHDIFDSSNMRLIETIEDDCRYCYRHTFEYDVSKDVDEIGTLHVTVYTKEGEIQNVAVSQSAAVKVDWDIKKIEEEINKIESTTTSEVNQSDIF